MYKGFITESMQSIYVKLWEMNNSVEVGYNKANPRS